MNFEKCKLAPDARLHDLFTAIRPDVDACFATARFDPPIHENRNYEVSYDGSGNATQVRLETILDNPPVPRIDACLGVAIAKIKAPVLGACVAKLSYTANCVPGWPGQCGKPPPK